MGIKLQSMSHGLQGMRLHLQELVLRAINFGTLLEEVFRGAVKPAAGGKISGTLSVGSSILYFCYTREYVLLTRFLPSDV